MKIILGAELIAAGIACIGAFLTIDDVRESLGFFFGIEIVLHAVLLGAWLIHSGLAQ